MQCDCIGTFTNLVKENAEKQLGVPASVDCQNVGFTLNENELTTSIFIGFKVTADKPKYRRGNMTKVIAGFCPFCGTPATKKKEEE